jgi:hypothetical protein
LLVRGERGVEVLLGGLRSGEVGLRAGLALHRLQFLLRE